MFIRLPKSTAGRWGLALFGFAILDALSVWGWTNPLVSSAWAALLACIWLVIASRWLRLGVVLLLTELILGSFGYLFTFTYGSTRLSLRFLLFGAAFALMLYRIVRNREHVIFSHPMRWWFVGVIGALVWATGSAYVHWNDFGTIVLDGNGYLYLLLLPLFLDAAQGTTREDWLRYANWLILPVIAWLTLRTLGLLYVFTHLFPEQLVSVYKWWRDSGLGEITPAGGGFFRIFSQSHIYSALAAAVGFGWLWGRLKQSNFNPKGLLYPTPYPVKSPDGDHGASWLLPTGYTLIPLLAVVASLSRSLWLGLAVAWLLAPVLSLKQGTARQFLKYALLSSVLVASAAGAVLATSRVVWPLPALGAASAEAFTSRFGKGEAAGQARLALLEPLWFRITQHPVVGSGFGTTVLYYSTDPRAVKSTAGGSGYVNTYALEWGYLDFWLKLGLVGLLVFLGFLWQPWWKGVKLWRQGEAVGLLVLALTALYVTHVTTPYLNHPLGLGAVLVCIALLLASPQPSSVI